MQIDPFTVGAQIVNFLVLVALLKRFLYGPILRAMDEREEKIATRLREAAVAREEAERAAEHFRQVDREFEQAREAKLAATEQEVQTRRKRLLTQARSEVDAAKERWNGELRREQQAFRDEFRRQAARQVFAVSRRALADLAEADLEERMVTVFVDKLGRLDEGERRRIADQVHENGAETVVHTAYPCSDEVRTKILAALRDSSFATDEVRFETSDDPVAGIELRAGGHKLAWSVNDYLEGLEETLLVTFDRDRNGAR